MASSLQLDNCFKNNTFSNKLPFILLLTSAKINNDIRNVLGLDKCQCLDFDAEFARLGLHIVAYSTESSLVRDHDLVNNAYLLVVVEGLGDTRKNLHEPMVFADLVVLWITFICGRMGVIHKMNTTNDGLKVPPLHFLRNHWACIKGPSIPSTPNVRTSSRSMRINMTNHAINSSLLREVQFHVMFMTSAATKED